MASHGWNVDIPAAEYYGPVPAEWQGRVVVRDPGALIREITDTPKVAIDTETTGLVVWKDIPLYFSLAWNNRRATVHHSLLPYFMPIFRDPYREWVLANAKYDAHILANVGCTLEGKLVDTQVAHSLLYEEQPHGLKYMAKQLLGWKWSDFQDTFGKIRKGFGPADLMRKAEVENFPLLVEYAANDAWGTLAVDDHLGKELKSANTHSLYSKSYPYIETLEDLYKKVEVPYTKVLWKNERNGIMVDMPYLQSLKPIAEAEIKKLEQDIAKEAGWLVKPRSNPHLLKWLVEECGLQPLRMTKGGKSGQRSPSVDSKFLEHYADQGHKGCQLVLEHRSVSKLHGTYVVGLSDLADPNDRIHTRFNQDVARCMPAGELVLTNRGYIPVETVKVGDLVLTHKGRPRKVTKVSKHRPTPIYKVTLKNGATLKTTGHHEYKTKDGWSRADKLRSNQEVVTRSSAERWKKVPEWPKYSVSSWGRVRNDETGNVLTPQPKSKWGHLKVALSKNGAQKRGTDKKDFPIHRLVLITFKPKSSGELIRHKNGVSWDNSLENLTYGTTKENIQDAVDHGAMSGAPLLTQQQVEEIRSAKKLGQPPSSTSKLSFQRAQEIRARYAENEGRAELAREYKVSFQAIDNIVKDRTWTKPVEGLSATELGERYGVSAAAIRDIWAERRWPRGRQRTYPTAFICSQVKTVKQLQPQVTYGLTVEEDHSHVTGGIVTHNTGRLSSADPNLQNIPNVEKDKWKLRGAFVARPGWKLIVADYGQLEMRLLAAAAGERDMIDIFLKGWDIHTGNAAMVYGIPYEEIVDARKIEKQVKKGELPESAMTARVLECIKARYDIKAVGFGLNYGMGAPKLARTLGVSVEAANRTISQYMGAYPAVEHFYKDAIAETERTGYAFTILGRRRNVPEIASSRRDERSKAERIAVNTQIQGSAADVVKCSQIILDKCGLDKSYGCHSLVQVHDELVHECPDEYVEKCKEIIVEHMEHPFISDLVVPLEVEAGTGQTWLEAK